MLPIVLPWCLHHMTIKTKQNTHKSKFPSRKLQKQHHKTHQPLCFFRTSGNTSTQHSTAPGDCAASCLPASFRLEPAPAVRGLSPRVSRFALSVPKPKYTHWGTHYIFPFYCSIIRIKQPPPPSPRMTTDVFVLCVAASRRPSSYVLDLILGLV